MIENDAKKLTQICDWINEHLNESIGWVQLSQSCGLSHAEIQRLFQSQLRVSPMQWIRQQREIQAEAAKKQEANQYRYSEDMTYALFKPKKNQP